MPELWGLHLEGDSCLAVWNTYCLNLVCLVRPGAGWFRRPIIWGVLRSIYIKRNQERERIWEKIMKQWKNLSKHYHSELDDNISSNWDYENVCKTVLQTRSLLDIHGTTFNFKFIRVIYHLFLILQGQIQDFQIKGGGGGAQKYYGWTVQSFYAGVQDPIKGPENFRVLDACSLMLTEHILKHSDTKLDQNFGGRGVNVCWAPACICYCLVLKSDHLC